MQNLFNIEDKIILISGSTRGLGNALAKGYCEAGAHVIINGRSRESVDHAVTELKSEGGKASGYPFDVADSGKVETSVAQIEQEVGPIDVLVNNAGIQRRGPLEELSDEDWQAVIDMDLSAAFYLAKHVGRGMIRRKKGKIINITSLMAEGMRPTTGNYCAAKGGLKMLTKAMAGEWGKYNIQVNAIGPGYFLTDLTRPLAENAEFDAWVKKETPAARWGNPEELVGAAIFLASKASDFVNGHTIYVDGGWLATL